MCGQQVIYVLRSVNYSQWTFDVTWCDTGDTVQSVTGVIRLRFWIKKSLFNSKDNPLNRV